MRLTLLASFGLSWIALPLASTEQVDPRDPAADVDAIGVRMVQYAQDRRFWISYHEISISQFREFVLNTGYKTQAEQGRGGLGIDRETGAIREDSSYNWSNIGAKQHVDDPVLNVSVADAQAFCRWLSAVDSKSYRLADQTDWNRHCQTMADAGNPTAAELAKHERTWYYPIAQAHPAVRAFQAEWFALSGRSAPEVGERLSAPTIVREALANWNFAGHPASRFGFPIVRIVRIDGVVDALRR